MTEHETNTCIACGKTFVNEDVAWLLFDGSWLCDYACMTNWERAHPNTWMMEERV